MLARLAVWPKSVEASSPAVVAALIVAAEEFALSVGLHHLYLVFARVARVYADLFGSPGLQNPVVLEHNQVY